MRISSGGAGEELRALIDAAGYFPELVWEVIGDAVGGEAIESALVQREPTITAGAVGSHMTVVVLTGTRLLLVHVDDTVSGPDGGVTAAATVDAVRLSAIRMVGSTRMVEAGGAGRRTVTLAIGWGGSGRIDLEPATCGDPSCEADHGYTGSIRSDDVFLRVSDADEGPDRVGQALAFARALSRATSRA
jgi:hypothetical protein